ncbi:hypothetical protein PCE1_000572 [Barthelona sp. PCE]
MPLKSKKGQKKRSPKRAIEKSKLVNTLATLNPGDKHKISMLIKKVSDLQQKTTEQEETIRNLKNSSSDDCVNHQARITDLESKLRKVITEYAILKRRYSQSIVLLEQYSTAHNSLTLDTPKPEPSPQQTAAEVRNIGCMAGIDVKNEGTQTDEASPTVSMEAYQAVLAENEILKRQTQQNNLFREIVRRSPLRQHDNEDSLLQLTPSPFKVMHRPETPLVSTIDSPTDLSVQHYSYGDSITDIIDDLQRQMAPLNERNELSTLFEEYNDETLEEISSFLDLMR